MVTCCVEQRYVSEHVSGNRAMIYRSERLWSSWGELCTRNIWDSPDQPWSSGVVMCVAEQLCESFHLFVLKDFIQFQQRLLVIARNTTKWSKEAVKFGWKDTRLKNCFSGIDCCWTGDVGILDFISGVGEKWIIFLFLCENWLICLCDFVIAAVPGKHASSSL